MVYGIVQLINNSPKVTDPRVAQILDPDELALYNSTTKPSKLCGTMLSAITARAGFNIDQEIYINNMLGQVAANVSLCARIKLQAMPYGEDLCMLWSGMATCLLPREAPVCDPWPHATMLQAGPCSALGGRTSGESHVQQTNEGIISDHTQQNWVYGM